MEHLDGLLCVATGGARGIGRAICAAFAAEGARVVLTEWHRVDAVNTDGCFLGCRYALNAMQAAGCGSIINLSLTPMWDALLSDGPDREARKAAMVADTPLKRFGTVEEVAALCVYLASPVSAYMTGAELTLDVGLLAGSAASPGD